MNQKSRFVPQSQTISLVRYKHKYIDSFVWLTPLAQKQQFATHKGTALTQTGKCKYVWYQSVIRIWRSLEK